MKVKEKQGKVFAFIDSQNLNFGTSKDVTKNGILVYQGWKLDMKRFRQYLSDKFRVTKALLFIGYIEANKEMYRHFEKYGYELVFKPTVKDAMGKPKGNVDAEIVLYAARLLYEDYDQAVFVSGDGDFRCLYEFMEKEKKLKSIVIPNKFSESSLLKDFGKYKTFLYRDKSKLEKRKK